MSSSRYLIGIDLGTSNSALAYLKKGEEHVQLLEVEQVTRPGEISPCGTLPSAVYFPIEKEVREADVMLPWMEQASTREVIGKWALERGSLSPDRLVVSAKSWLVNPFTDPSEKILPWDSEISTKISPLEALSRYLTHLKDAFLHSKKEEELEMKDLELVITIPASFDELARQRVVEASKNSGFLKLSLLEEPQAAFYSYISQNKKTWQKEVQAGDLILVCDLGGGTCDFSLIAVHDEGGNLGLERIAVGDHILLGGDNMDMAIAYMMKEEFEKEGLSLDSWQFLSLQNEARRGKEALLASDLEEVPLSITKRGNKLIANTVTRNLKREDLNRLVLEGFFPLSDIEEDLEDSDLGFQEWGLPYEKDPAVSKHLATFLKRAFQTLKASPQLQDFLKLPEDKNFLSPTHILFNGGVFSAVVLKERVLELLKSWDKDSKIKVLENKRLDLAVAEGAAYFAHTKASGKGVRIKAGTMNSYYIGLEAARLAVPGVKAKVRGLCIVPQGTEEGSELPSPKAQFALKTGDTVRFRLFHSKKRGTDGVGSLIDDAEFSLEESRALNVSLDGDGAEKRVPVTLQAGVNDVGTLEVFMKHMKSEKKWKLEFDLRKSESG